MRRFAFNAAAVLAAYTFALAITGALYLIGQVSPLVAVSLIESAVIVAAVNFTERQTAVVPPESEAP